MAHGRGRTGGLIGIALMAAAMAGGCLRAEAKTPAPAPVLQTPEPPARLVIPVSIEPPAPTPTPTPTPTPRPATNTGGRATAPPPPVTPPVQEATPPPPTVLQTNASQTDLEKRAKDRLEVAQRDLLRVSAMTLGKDAQEQYQSAKRFVRMAQDALAAKNFVQAVYCADKAATLAGLLAK